MDTRDEHMSWRTFALIFAGSALLVILASAAVAATSYLPAALADIARGLVSDSGSIIFGVLAASVLFYAASRFHKGNAMRRIWELFGVAMTVRVIGDIIWVALEIRSHYADVPYPSVADAFYLAFY